MFDKVFKIRQWQYLHFLLLIFKSYLALGYSDHRQTISLGKN